MINEKIIILLIIHFYSYHSITCLIRSMKKISDDGDYFVILDNGLYIYNFEKSKRINLTIFNESPFETTYGDNNIIISKNFDIILNETKISALINHHLYIYTYGSSNNKVDYLLIDDLKNSINQAYYSFNVEIKNFTVTILFIKSFSNIVVNPIYTLETLFSENYLTGKFNEPNTEIEINNDYYNHRISCKIDENDSTIKCVYDNKGCKIYFLTINKTDNGYEKESHLIHEYSGVCRVGNYRYTNLTYSSNSDTIFVCALERGIKCFYSNTPNLIFQEITYNNFEENCISLKTNFNKEKNQFELSCIKSGIEHLYIFNATDLNNIVYINVTDSINIEENFLIYNNILDTYSYVTNNQYDFYGNNAYEDSKMQFISLYNLKRESNKNIPIINFNKCEDELKYYYNITNDNDIYIVKIEYKFKELLIPIIEYEVYYLNNSNLEKLNLTLCNNIKIEILIPVNITDGIDKHNPKSAYYNDICTKAKSDNGTDIIIKDRINEFVDKNMTLCEDNCEFINYDNINKRVNCSCEVKTFMSFINEIKIDKDKLFKNFRDINYITNLQVIKCYKIAFQINNIKINYGFYIFCFLIIIIFICTLLFYIKFYSLLIQEINEIISAIKNKNNKNNLNQSNLHIKKKKDDNKLFEKINKKSNKDIILTENKIKSKKKEDNKLYEIDKKSNKGSVLTEYRTQKKKKNKNKLYEQMDKKSNKDSVFTEYKTQKKKKDKNKLIESKDNKSNKDSVFTEFKTKKKKKDKNKLIEQIDKKSNKGSAFTEYKTKKNKNKNKTKILISEIEYNLETKKEKSNKKNKKVKFFNKSETNNILIKSKNKLINEQYENILKYNEYELNSLPYKEALKDDNRNFSQYYVSLMKKNHLLFFSFFPNNDYNSQIIKICLFFFFFSSNLTINALFFTDKTMHKIYKDEGSFNLNYQIPQIIYSSLISGVINALIKYLSLTEKSIISIKHFGEIEKLDIKSKKLLKEIKIKLFFFFLITFILLFFFMFYITCFCGIYVNTQIQLIKDTIISFFLSFLYPFFIYLIPSILRFCSLKTKKCKKECIYKISKLF